MIYVKIMFWLARMQVFEDADQSLLKIVLFRRKMYFYDWIIFLLKAYRLLQQYCWNNTVATVLLQQYCSNSTVATVLLQQYCCNSTVATVLLQQYCTVLYSTVYISMGPYGVPRSLSMGPYGVPGSPDSWTRGLGTRDLGSWGLGTRDLFEYL